MAATGPAGGAERRWDRRPGVPLGPPLDAHDGAVATVATAVLDGRPAAVTGGLDGTARIWDLGNGESLGPPLTGHRGPVTAVATAEIEGRPFVLTGDDEEGTVRIWDVRGGRWLGRSLENPIWDDGVEATGWVATAEVAGRPLAVVNSDETLRVWDLPAGAERDHPRYAEGGSRVTALTVSTVDG
ncbi:WD40 repeat domain-containing protein, partial [Streptomyces sp. WM6368]|uniref:WD40 repeat domain-containing protein n=1 Tax=Streptomyces sp. WM6368 TaxID=1415554 RepID=UPI000AD8C324